MTLCSMYFNDVNFALGLMFAAFRGVGSAPSGYASEVFHSRVFSAPVYWASDTRVALMSELYCRVYVSTLYAENCRFLLFH